MQTEANKRFRIIAANRLAVRHSYSCTGAASSFPKVDGVGFAGDGGISGSGGPASLGTQRRETMKETNEDGFRRWLRASRRYGDPAIRDTISRCRRVERHYGDLDCLYDQGRIVILLDDLQCSPAGQPSHRIPFRKGAKPIEGTASLRHAVSRYREFRDHT